MALDTQPDVVSKAHIRRVMCNCCDEDYGECTQCRYDKWLIEQASKPKKETPHVASRTPEIRA